MNMDTVRRTISGIDVGIRRKRMRYIRVLVKRDCSVIVSAPLKISDAKIDEFVISKKEWITGNLQRYKEMNEKGSNILENNGRIFLFGRPYTLTLIDGPAHTIVSDDGILMMFPNDRDVASSADELYRSELKAVLPDIIERYQLMTGLSCTGWTVRKMKSRWGSCNTRTHHISLSLSLAQKPIECIEYVVLHELIHIAAPNHGPVFKSLMSEHMPDWKERRKLLNS